MEYPIVEVRNFCIETDRKNEKVYKSRGQGNTLRRLKQNFSGKMAELFVNQHLGAGQEGHILKDYGMGKFHSDLSYAGRGFSIKSQDEDSIKRYGEGRFIFGTNDPLESDIYCGVLVKYDFHPFAMIFGFNEYETFEAWTKAITSISCKYAFVCHRRTLELDIWDSTDKHLTKKKVLVAASIPTEARIDLKPNFPKTN